VIDVGSLSDEAVVRAFGDVVSSWANYRGLEVLIAWQAAARKEESLDQELPGWSRETLESAIKNPETATHCRKMLKVFLESDDNEVVTWTRSALDKYSEAQAQVADPLTILALGSVYGIIIIGSILAARVKKIGSAEFYEGIPKELAPVIKAGSSIQLPNSGNLTSLPAPNDQEQDPTS